MIDLHCHLIPGIDDGPPTLEGSLDLARAMVAAGTRIAVATPHIDGRWNVDPLRVPDLVADLRMAIAAERIDLVVLAGGEVALTRLPEMDAAQRDAVRLGAGPYLLLESPHTALTTDFDHLVLSLVGQGMPILLAHPERCPTFLRHPHKLPRLVEAGVLCSVTAGALAGRFGEPSYRLAIGMLREGLVHDVASDAHDARRRGPELAAGLARAERDLPGLSDLVPWLTEAVPQAILIGAPLPPAPPAPAAWAAGAGLSEPVPRRGRGSRGSVWQR